MSVVFVATDPTLALALALAPLKLGDAIYCIQAIKQQELINSIAEIEQIENGERKTKWGANKSSSNRLRTEEEDQIENGEGD
jgi:hypothetical protein